MRFYVYWYIYIYIYIYTYSNLIYIIHIYIYIFSNCLLEMSLFPHVSSWCHTIKMGSVDTIGLGRFSVPLLCLQLKILRGSHAATATEI